MRCIQFIQVVPGARVKPTSTDFVQHRRHCRTTKTGDVQQQLHQLPEHFEAIADAAMRQVGPEHLMDMHRMRNAATLEVGVQPHC